SFNLVNQSSKTSVVYIEYIRVMYPIGYIHARNKLECMGLQQKEEAQLNDWASSYLTLPYDFHQCTARI
ncbi:hypothetical protein, partial [Acinetobacter sp. YH12075]|uniref:hypothetical protein n=1 Tax=Acinetobacter sp. YH12075 TaxID=2601070 RepID=UPI001C550E1C